MRVHFLIFFGHNTTPLGKQFIYKIEVDEHGRSLWKEAIDQEFSKWIYVLKQNDRELFKEQYSVSENTLVFIDFSPLGMRDVEAYSRFNELLVATTVKVTES